MQTLVNLWASPWEGNNYVMCRYWLTIISLLVSVYPNCLLMHRAIPFNNSHHMMTVHEQACFRSSTGFFDETFIFLIEPSSFSLLASPHWFTWMTNGYLPVDEQRWAFSQMGLFPLIDMDSGLTGRICLFMYGQVPVCQKVSYFVYQACGQTGICPLINSDIPYVIGMTIVKQHSFQSWIVHQQAISTNGNFHCCAHLPTNIMFAIGQSLNDCCWTGLPHSSIGNLDKQALTSPQLEMR